ncbi:rhodanese-like domain-containing protein [Polaromonas sp. P1(28)-13]|nr:rhodanese-like domain-containing protein [Polaromonas sp. P1(28)-13]
MKAVEADLVRTAREVVQQTQTGFKVETAADVLGKETFPGVAALNTAIFAGEAEGYLYGQDAPSTFINSPRLMNAVATAIGTALPYSLVAIQNSNVFLRAPVTADPKVDGLRISRECARRCPVMAPLSGREFQFKGSVGDKVDLTQYATSLKAVAWRRQDFSDRAEPTSFVITGGDLLVVDDATERIVWIHRNFWTYGRQSLDDIGHWQEPRRLEIDKIDLYVSPKLSIVQDALRSGNYGATTPETIPGGTVVATGALAKLLSQRAQGKGPVLVSVIDEKWGIPGAVKLPYAGVGGSFDDTVSQRLGEDLKALTAGRADTPLVFYCHHAQCWLSFNAALRAIKLGYTNVMWYRYGLERWMHNRFPLEEVKAL